MKNLPKIKVVGIGGSGVNTITRMHREAVKGVDLIAANTDIQSLKTCPVSSRILLGEKTTGGLGAGMDVKLGEKAAKESQDKLKEAIKGAEMVFLTCGLGGGSGSSGIPILGKIARELGILTVAVVTLPFSFEGSQRRVIAKKALAQLQRQVDALLCIPNDKLLQLVGPQTSVANAFWLCDDVLREAVKGISDLVSLPGIINVDFADLRSVLENAGWAFLGIGRAKGEKRGQVAANMALQSPLLDFSIKNSQGILLNIAGKDDLNLAEVNGAATLIKQVVSPGTKIVFGVSEDPALKEGEIKITVIATSKDK